MADETVVPTLPCRDIDEVSQFYRALGFEQTHRQIRPNPYVALQREDLHLHFFGVPDFDPEQSYGSCLVFVPDAGALYEAFSAGMRAVYGKLLVSGIPRMTRPRRRRNTGTAPGFTLIDPGGNQIRIFTSEAEPEEPAESADTAPTEGAANVAAGPAKRSLLAKALLHAVVLGDAKGDSTMAVEFLDAALAREGGSATPADLVEALVYRAELALRLEDTDLAKTLLARVHEIPLEDADRERLADALTNAREMQGN